ncbi:MAG TPA: hypothetical protein VFG30_10615 [Polyangiales bacterium]|nr:hypothetical protein [Polyangiales bacterium]
MGLFDFPRIHIVGTHEVNPGTGNNNSASPGDELTVTSDSERVQPIGFDKSDVDFRRWMTGLDELGMLRSQWNYYGDMSFRFTDVTVRSVQLGPNQLIRSHAQDKLIGASVHLNNAIVCDNNPEGFNGTQVFAEALEIHAPDALQGAGSFVSRPPDRATTRWLNWQRNVSFQTPFKLPDPAKPASGEITSGAAGAASATFQCGIKVNAEDLALEPSYERVLNRSRFKLRPEENASPALDALVAEIRGGACGLVFRYNLYLTYPRISDTELAKRFERGERAANPARGHIVGTIAPWYEHEPSTITMGRLLKPAAPYANQYRSKKQFFLSPAVATQNTKTQSISIDLANCLPEDGPDGDKYNLGKITLGYRHLTDPKKDPATNTATVEPIGTVTNDRETYLDCGGIYDFAYADRPEVRSALDDDNNELALESSLYGVLLYEPEYMLASDCTCNYLDQPPPGQTWDDPPVKDYLAQQSHPALTGRIDLLLLRRGKLPAKEVAITVEEWRQTPTGFPGNYGVYRYPTLQKRSKLKWSPNQKFDLRPTDGPGLRVYRFVPENNWPQDIDERDIAQFAIREAIVELRVLPYDDYSKVRPDELTLDFIYQQVFRYYDLITPAMSEAMDLKDPSIWKMPTAARYVLLSTNTDFWTSPQYMPRTRDLSRARRELLQRFCRSLLPPSEQA